MSESIFIGDRVFVSGRWMVVQDREESTGSLLVRPQTGGRDLCISPSDIKRHSPVWR